MSDESERAAVLSVDPLTLFPEGIRRAVEGLAFLGQLTEEVEFCGHTFGLRTLKPQHRFAIATVLQPYRNTVYEVEVYEALHVAAALTHVDGVENFCPAIGPSVEGLVRGRLNFITSDDTGWYPPTISYLFERQSILEATAAKAVKDLNFLSTEKSVGISSSSWQDALTEPESSEDAMNAIIQAFMTSN